MHPKQSFSDRGGPITCRLAAKMMAALTDFKASFGHCLQASCILLVVTTKCVVSALYCWHLRFILGLVSLPIHGGMLERYFMSSTD